MDVGRNGDVGLGGQLTNQLPYLVGQLYTGAAIALGQCSLQHLR